MATAPVLQPDGKPPMILGVGSMLVVVYPRWGGQLARFLLFRQAGPRERPVLLASGSEENLSTCLVKAKRAAWVADAQW